MLVYQKVVITLMVIATCQQGTLAASYASFELQRRARRAISAISNLSGDRGTLRPLDVSKENGPKFYKHLVLKKPKYFWNEKEFGS